MTELYTNMRYLQYGTLQRLGLGKFDAWASTFGETQTAIELASEGTGYRAKTRFSKFFNLPELISLFKESADIQTPDMLKLPVPEAVYENVVLNPSSYQKEMVQSLAERAEAVRNRLVEPAQDNMLSITNDSRKLALDQRLVNSLLPDDSNSKTSACADRAFAIWEQTKGQKSAQLIFCDTSTPKNDGEFNVYDDVKQKLMAKGVPENEIAFIHTANTETKKAELFGKVRTGQVRFLLGSTQKMGAGTNVQDRLIALHHLDIPWVRLEVAPRGCQKEIVQKIHDGGADYCIALKGNQPALLKDTEEYFDAYADEMPKQETAEKGHGRIEKREYRLLTDIGWLEKGEEWAGIKGLGMAKQTVCKGEETMEYTRYFITSLTDIDEFAYAVRKHWSIENQLHWCLDVIFREDAARARKDNPPRNMNVLRKTALSLLNKAKKGRISKKKMMFKAALNPKVLLSILFCEKK